MRKYNFLLCIYVIVICLIIIAISTYYSFNAVEDFTDLQTLPYVISRTQNPEVKDIPYVVYQTWHTSAVAADMYDTYMQNVNMNPEFEFQFYDDKRCIEYLEQNYDKSVVNAFNSLKPGAYKADLWRICILYKGGGIYMDIKFKTETPLKELLMQNETMFVKDLHKSGVYQGFIVAKPGEPSLKQGIEKIVENVNLRNYGTDHLDVSGPTMLGAIVNNTDPDKVKLKLKLLENNRHSIVPMYDIHKNIVVEYQTYRINQRTTGTPHYDEMWKNKDVFV